MRVLGEGCSSSGEVRHLGTPSHKERRQMKFLPTELPEKAHLVRATWKTIPNSLVFRVLKHQVVNGYHEKERIKLLKVSFTLRKVCGQGRKEPNFEKNGQGSLNSRYFSCISLPLHSTHNLVNPT